MPGAMRNRRGDRNISKAHKQGTNGSSVGGMKMYTEPSRKWQASQERYRIVL